MSDWLSVGAAQIEGVDEPADHVVTFTHGSKSICACCANKVPKRRPKPLVAVLPSDISEQELVDLAAMKIELRKALRTLTKTGIEHMDAASAIKALEAANQRAEHYKKKLEWYMRTAIRIENHLAKLAAEPVPEPEPVSPESEDEKKRQRAKVLLKALLKPKA